jgi:hypothetical protein
MTKRKGRGPGVRRISGAGEGFEKHSEIDDDVYVTSELPEIPPATKKPGQHEVTIQVFRGRYLASCSKCLRTIASRPMLPALLDDAVSHGKIVKIVGAGEQEDGIWQMIKRRRRLRRFRVF